MPFAHIYFVIIASVYVISSLLVLFDVERVTNRSRNTAAPNKRVRYRVSLGILGASILAFLAYSSFDYIEPELQLASFVSGASTLSATISFFVTASRSATIPLLSAGVGFMTLAILLVVFQLI